MVTHELPNGLMFYWYDADSNPPGQSTRAMGEFMHALERLAFVVNELETVRYTRDIQHAMRRLEYHMHNYLVRLYEVRERAMVLVATHTGAAKHIADKLKKPSLRAATAAQLRPAKPKLIDGIVRLLGLLDQDVELRNTQTHAAHLQLGLGGTVR